MFCSGCGKLLENPGSGLPCECGTTPQQANQPYSMYPAGDMVNAITSKFSFNQLVIYGGCIFLFICLFLPFMSISFNFLGMRDTTRQLGYGMAFDSFAGFLDLLVPLLVVAALAVLTGLSIVKIESAKLLIAGFSFLGAYLSISVLARLSSASGVGVGAIFFFILWLFVAAAAFMEYKGIHLIKF